MLTHVELVTSKLTDQNDGMVSPVSFQRILN